MSSSFLQHQRCNLYRKASTDDPSSCYALSLQALSYIIGHYVLISEEAKVLEAQNFNFRQLNLLVPINFIIIIMEHSRNCALQWIKDIVCRNV